MINQPIYIGRNKQNIQDPLLGFLDVLFGNTKINYFDTTETIDFNNKYYNIYNHHVDISPKFHNYFKLLYLRTEEIFSIIKEHNDNVYLIFNISLDTFFVFNILKTMGCFNNSNIKISIVKDFYNLYQPYFKFLNLNQNNIIHNNDHKLFEDEKNRFVFFNTMNNPETHYFNKQLSEFPINKFKSHFQNFSLDLVEPLIKKCPWGIKTGLQYTFWLDITLKQNWNTSHLYFISNNNKVYFDNIVNFYNTKEFNEYYFYNMESNTAENIINKNTVLEKIIKNTNMSLDDLKYVYNPPKRNTITNKTLLSNGEIITNEGTSIIT